MWWNAMHVYNIQLYCVYIHTLSYHIFLLWDHGRVIKSSAFDMVLLWGPWSWWRGLALWVNVEVFGGPVVWSYLKVAVKICQNRSKPSEDNTYIYIYTNINKSYSKARGDIRAPAIVHILCGKPNDQPFVGFTTPKHWAPASELSELSARALSREPFNRTWDANAPNDKTITGSFWSVFLGLMWILFEHMVSLNPPANHYFHHSMTTTWG